MSFVDSSQKLWTEVSSIVSDENLSLYDLERLGSGGLRVVVAQNGPKSPESPRGQGGVTTGDCTRICRRLMTFFSVEGAELGVAAEPQLEVSSPGINRTLRLPQHFVDAVGERVKIVWQEEKDGKSHSHTTIGVLEVFEKNCLSLIDERSGDRRDVLLNDVRKAMVDFPF